MTEHELDTRGLTCPIPIMRLKKRMESLSSGQRLRVVASDPSCVMEIATYAKKTGNTLLESSKSSEGDFVFVLKKA